MRVAGIVNDSIVDGPGLRLAVYLQGCYHNCPGCHNPQTHDISGGYEIGIEEIIELMDRNPLLDGVTFTGGEPLLQVDALTPLAREIKKRKLHLMLYTGYTWEKLMSEKQKYEPLLENVDTVVDGPYVEKLRSLGLAYRGSGNQRMIEVREKRKAADF